MGIDLGVRGLASSVIGLRSELAKRLGQTFGGSRDLYSAFGWKTDLTYDDMLAKYSRQGITSRIVNAYPDAIWARPPTIIGNDNVEELLNGKFVKGEIKEFGLAQKLNLYHHIGMADRLCGLGKFSILVLGFSDASSSGSMATPAGTVVKRGPKPKNGRKNELLWIRPYGYGDVKIHKYTEDVSDSNYGMPEIYEIKVNRKNVSGKVVDIKPLLIHHSRVIHIADCTVDSSIEGYPIIARVYNHLDDMMKISGGAAEALWLGARKGLHFDLDKDMELSGSDKKSMVEEIEKYVHGLTRMIRTRGVNINDLGADHVDPNPVFNVIMSEISTSSGIPQRIFIGSEQGKLASEQDRSNWSGRIEERRELHAEPRIMRPFINKLMFAGVLEDSVYSFSWPDAFRMSPLERADAAAKQARSATNLQSSIITGHERDVPILSRQEARDIVFSHGELRVGLDKGIPKTEEVTKIDTGNVNNIDSKNIDDGKDIKDEKGKNINDSNSNVDDKKIKDGDNVEKSSSTKVK